jgi:hypothetical protein
MRRANAASGQERMLALQFSRNAGEAILICEREQLAVFQSAARSFIATPLARMNMQSGQSKSAKWKNAG